MAARPATMWGPIRPNPYPLPTSSSRKEAEPKPLGEAREAGEVSIELVQRNTGNVEAGNANQQEPLTTTGPVTTHAEYAESAQSGGMSSYQYIIFARLRQWWSQHVEVTLDNRSDPPVGGDPRDFLALERTFLGWLRTSSALVSFGVVVTQLLLLHDLDPTVGKIFGSVLACGGTIVTLLGCIRYFRQQKLLGQGKTLAGGWHITVMMTLLTIILLALVVIVLLQD